jgi:transcriptional regulator with XRE-family HTH domain
MGYTYDDMAKFMGISRPNVMKKMKDESGNSITLAEAAKLCIILKINNPGEYFYAFKERQSNQ